MPEVMFAGRPTIWTEAGPVSSSGPDAAIIGLSQSLSARWADSAPLSYFGFATATWIMATVAVGAFKPVDFLLAAPVLLVFGGVAQFIGGLLSLARGRALLGVEFCTFGTLNTVAAVVFLLVGNGTLADQPGNATVVFGCVLESYGAIAAMLTLAGLRTNLVAIAVLVTRAAGYLLAGLPFLVGQIGIGAWGIAGHAGAGFLFASALFAAYAGSARLVNSSWGREVLPTWGKP